MISRKRDQGSYKYKNNSHESERVVSYRKISILIPITKMFNAFSFTIFDVTVASFADKSLYKF